MTEVKLVEVLPCNELCPLRKLEANRTCVPDFMGPLETLLTKITISLLKPSLPPRKNPPIWCQVSFSPLGFDVTFLIFVHLTIMYLHNIYAPKAPWTDLKMIQYYIATKTVLINFHFSSFLGRRKGTFFSSPFFMGEWRRGEEGWRKARLWEHAKK